MSSLGKTNGSYPPELSTKLRDALDPVGIKSVLDALRKSPVKLDSILSRSVAFGAAYHHAGQLNHLILLIIRNKIQLFM